MNWSRFRILLPLLAGVLLLSITYWSVGAAAADSDNDTIFYVEPYALFAPSIGASVKVTQSGTTIDNSSNHGAGGYGGLDLGWRVNYAHVFLFYDYGTGKFSGATESFNQQDYGGGLAWEWNIPLMTVVEIGGSSLSGSVGSSGSYSGFLVRGGIDYFFSKSLLLNVLYSQNTLSASANGETVNANLNAISVGLSIPFDIKYPSNWWRDREKGSQ